MKAVAQTFLERIASRCRIGTVSPAFLPAAAILSFAGWKTRATCLTAVAALRVGKTSKLTATFFL
jgi:hypothetical protein